MKEKDSMSAKESRKRFDKLLNAMATQPVPSVKPAIEDFESAVDQANSTPRTNQPLKLAGPAAFPKQNNWLSQIS